MSESKQVKVDNWGIYFLQRLKHFFNRTDYCDLTLQFQDNAQLKVHRLVLSACTEYFELLERTCEMYEDCLVMPDDLQADVVVPIVNFMYTGQLEFRMELLEKLHSTSEIMNMPVLTKLLDSHRPKNRLTHTFSKRVLPKHDLISAKLPTTETVPTTPMTQKRSYSKAFDKTVMTRDKKHFQAVNKPSITSVTNGGLVYRPPSPVSSDTMGKIKQQKFILGEPRPTRYELPEELDTDNIFENSFCNISYTSQPLMIHPETTKQYAKRPKQGQPSGSKKFKSATLDIVECKKISKEPSEQLFDESSSSAMISDETEMFKPSFTNVKSECIKDPNQLFDQLLDQNEDQLGKVTIETTKNNKLPANLDHAKIISEVLKKYPHLVKSNKNIKLKIFNNPAPASKSVKKQKVTGHSISVPEKMANPKFGQLADYTYETEVLDSKQAAKLIALGAENIEGPWICLICGTPGKALHFTSYFKFRRHLVEVHNEKPVLNICEYCGQRMSKRNHLLHHMYTKHGVEPPPQYNFPKCSQCNYVALTEALLVKHKLTHAEIKCFRCNVCPAAFNSSNLLLTHIQNTGHKYIADRKQNHQCIYCMRIFLRESNLYAHLKTHHKLDAVRDGIIDESDDEFSSKESIIKIVKNEPAPDYEDMEYQIQQKPDGFHFVKKQTESTTPSKQKILNSGLPPASSKEQFAEITSNNQTEHIQEIISTVDENNEQYVVIDNNEYVVSGNRLILRKATKQPTDEYILSEVLETKPDTNIQNETASTSMDYTTILNPVHTVQDNIQQGNILLKDPGNLAEPIPIYVSNEEQYKALMAANHNIIFDSNDGNKTLTVLTTPDAATLETTGIDLDSTQNNDMMIIQDNYPLNVSQAVVTDNSNIVVVYSHKVGDQNKEYQLITTQALGQQYVQSSAIITQNYDTVSTSTPVMSANVLDTSVATWQGDIHQNVTDQHTETHEVLQTIIQSDDSVQSTNAAESFNDMSNLPEVQISNIPNQTISDQNANESIAESLQQNPETELVQNICLDSETSNVEKSDHFVPNESLKKNGDTPENVHDTKSSEQADMETDQVMEPHSEPENVHENQEQTEIISMETESSEINDNIEESLTNVVNVEEVVNENELSTTEWTEQNVEIPTQETNDQTNILEEVHITEVISEEVEESIENIQQELDKQMSEATPVEAEVEIGDDVDEDSLEDHVLPEQEVDKPGTVKAINPQEKISSLLNDWDDNDSQDNPEINETPTNDSVKESASSDIAKDDKVTESDIVLSEAAEIEISGVVADDGIEENSIETETNESALDKDVIEKHDKIKSLVSDWDDEEEENKE